MGGWNRPDVRVRNILVRGTNWIGDAVMTFPALSAVRAAFPEARIQVLAKPWVAPIYQGHPATDRVLVFERPGRHQGPKGLWRLAGELKAKRFDLAVLFQNAIEAALIAWLARIPFRMGYKTDGRGMLLRPAVGMVPEDRRVHQVEYYLRMLERAGVTWNRDLEKRPVFVPRPEDRDRAEAFLRAEGIQDGWILGLAPGAAFGPAKRWPEDRFARAADLILSSRPGVALVFGSAGEKETAEAVSGQMSHKVVNLAGKTDLNLAAAVMARCGLFLANDSGLMHLAAALGVPLTAVFGSTDHRATAPLGDRIRLIRHDLDCAPCLKPVCPLKTTECLTQIQPEEVAEAGLGLIGE